MVEFFPVVTLMDFLWQRQPKLCNAFGWKCRTEIQKCSPLLKIAAQDRKETSWAKAKALWDFLP